MAAAAPVPAHATRATHATHATHMRAGSLFVRVAGLTRTNSDPAPVETVSAAVQQHPSRCRQLEAGHFESVSGPTEVRHALKATRLG
ncbi:hypothetical protein GCM10009786_19690 [Leucobacter alluvii]|uniref:Uncharacterized protein n=1 Tax=Leucobacter alluvii TaxID=340321 RepID=A0ABN3B6A6_9MICO